MTDVWRETDSSIEGFFNRLGAFTGPGQRHDELLRDEYEELLRLTHNVLLRILGVVSTSISLLVS